MLACFILLLFLQFYNAYSFDLGWSLSFEIDGPQTNFDAFGLASFDVSSSGSCILVGYEGDDLTKTMYLFDVSGNVPLLKQTISPLQQIGDWIGFGIAKYGQTDNSCLQLYQLAPSPGLQTAGNGLGGYFKIIREPVSGVKSTPVSEVGLGPTQVVFKYYDFVVNSKNLATSFFVENILPTNALETNNFKLHLFENNVEVIAIDHYLGNGFFPVVSAYDEESRLIVTIVNNQTLNGAKLMIQTLEINGTLTTLQDSPNDEFLGGIIAISEGGKYIVIASGEKRDEFAPDDENGFAVFAKRANQNFYSRVTFVEFPQSLPSSGNCTANNRINVSPTGYIIFGNYDQNDSTSSATACGAIGATNGANGNVKIYQINDATFEVNFIREIENPEPGIANFFGYFVNTDLLGERIAVSCPLCNNNKGRVFVYDASTSFITDSPSKSPTLSPTSLSPTQNPTVSPTFPIGEWKQDEKIIASDNGGLNGCLFGKNSFDLSSDGSCLMVGNDAASATSCPSSYIQLYSFDNSDTMTFIRKRSPQEYNSEWIQYQIDKPGQIANNCNFASFLTNTGAPPIFGDKLTAFVQVDTSQNPLSANPFFSSFSTNDPATLINNWAFNKDMSRVFIENFDADFFGDGQGAFVISMYSNGNLLSDRLSLQNTASTGLLYDEVSNRLVQYSQNRMTIYQIDTKNDLILVFQESVPDFYLGQTISFSSTGKYIAIAKGEFSIDGKNGIALYREVNGAYAQTGFFEVFSGCIGNGAISVSDLGFIAVSSFELNPESGAECGQAGNINGDNGKVEIFSITEISNEQDEIVLFDTIYSPERGPVFFGQSMDSDDLMYRIAVGCPQCDGNENGAVYVFSTLTRPPTSAPTFPVPTSAPTQFPTKSPTLDGSLGWEEDFFINGQDFDGSTNCKFSNQIFDLTDDGKCLVASYDVDAPLCNEIDSAVNTFSLNPFSHLFYSRIGSVQQTRNTLFQNQGYINSNDCNKMTWLTNRNTNNVITNGILSEINVKSPASFLYSTTTSAEKAIAINDIVYPNNGNLFFKVLEEFNKLDLDEPRSLRLFQEGIPIFTLENYLNSTSDKATTIGVDQESNHVFVFSQEKQSQIYKIENGNELVLIQTNIQSVYTPSRLGISKGGEFVVIAKGNSGKGDIINALSVFRQTEIDKWSFWGGVDIDDEECIGNGNIAVTQNGFIFVGSYDMDNSENADCGTSSKTKGDNGNVKIFKIDLENGNIDFVQIINSPELGAVFYGKNVDASVNGETFIVACPGCNADSGQIFVYESSVIPEIINSTSFPTRAPTKSTNAPVVPGSPTKAPTRAPTVPTFAPTFSETCELLDTWSKTTYNPFTIPNMLIPFTLVVYGVPWQYSFILFFLRESLTSLITCGENQRIPNVLISNVLNAMTGIIFARVILYNGGQRINANIFAKYTSRNDKIFTVAEIIWIISTSFVFNPAKFVTGAEENFNHTWNESLLFLLLGINYLFFNWKYQNELFQLQTAVILSFYTILNLIVYFYEDSNSMWLSIIIAYFFIIPTYIVKKFY